MKGYIFLFSESSPNGESVIAISSSNPEVEKYILDYAEHAKQKQGSPATVGQANTIGTAVRSFSVSTPEKTIIGSGRSFGDSFSDPFFAPYFVAPNLEGFDIRNWLRNLESFYDPNFAGSGRSVSATAVSNNGQVYGKVETRNLDSGGHK